MPVSALFENLRDGATIDQFLEWFPEVERHQLLAVLDHERGGPHGVGPFVSILFDQGTPARAHSRFPGAVQCVGKDGL